MAARRTDGYELAGADADDRGDRLLRAAAVTGLALIQAGVAGLFVSAWWRHVLTVVDAPSVGGVVWRLLTLVLFVWVLGAEVGALRRRRRAPVLVISLSLAGMVGAILLETLAPF
ncbi:MULTISPECIES: hypothetical protein [unclassified Isoptericola]|uniref:hypothetical protein n=1 Tax=unclassified Isoptericola TaxID=2623355 RepID=UPI00366A429D